MNGLLQLTIEGGTFQLDVSTHPHSSAGNLQMTTIALQSEITNVRLAAFLNSDERKALAAFLLSIPDDQP